jgi:hypothetical protein
MTARRDVVRDVLGPLDGARIPGGCDVCNAYQVPQCIGHKAWVLHVYHDDWCPLLREMER